MTDAAPRGATRGADAAWRHTPWWARVAVVVVAGVLAAELAVSLAGSRTVPEAPTSPYALGGQGTAALVALLHRVTTVTVATAPITPASVPPGSTLLVLDPRRWDATDASTARAVAASGGRVVFVGAAPAVPGPPLAARVTLRDVPVGPVVATAPGRLAYGVRALVTGTGALAATGRVAVVVRGRDGVFVARSGPVVWVASSAPLRNAALARLDDAALAWNLASPWRAGVVLDAADMVPPAEATGLRALPPWWLAALCVTALAVAAWLASAARRFGPLEPRRRALPPPRTGHAIAVGALLEALPADRVHEAASPVARAAHRELLATLGLDDRADATALSEAAAARGVPAWVVAAASVPPRSRDDAVATGRALAWLTKEGANL